MTLPSIIGGLNEEHLQALFNEGIRDLAKEGIAQLVRRALAARRATAVDLLLKELRKGTVTLDQVAAEQEVVSVLLRFRRAADEGTARLNLRLMAKVIAGKAFTGTLKADEFLYYAEMLASLRREEIILIATMRRLQRERPNAKANEQWGALTDALVPSVFASEPALRSAAMASLRTGLVMDTNTMEQIGLYTASPLMRELELMAPLDEALKEDDG